MRRILLVSVLLLALSCRPVSVIPGPEEPEGPDIPPTLKEGTISVALLKTLYTGAPTLIRGEYIIGGMVVSSDDQGNFYKTLVIDDGTGGIEIRLDMEQIFKRFKIFSHLRVRCNGLWLGSYGGTLQLGAEPFDDFETRAITEAEIATRLQTDTGFYGEIRPRELVFSELRANHISTFVAFEGVRFAEQEQGLDWTDTDPGSGENEGGTATSTRIDTDRHLVDAAGDTLVVRTSRYARFASWRLPEGTGRIEGVLGYFNGDFQLIVCDSQKFYPQRE